MQLLVAGARRSQRELLDAIAAERRVRVAVDEPGDRAEAAAVELAYVAVERRQVAHAADGLDRVARTQDVCVLDDVDLAQRGSAKRRVAAGGRGDLREVANEHPHGIAHASRGADGNRSPPRAAASIASG